MPLNRTPPPAGGGADGTEEPPSEVPRTTPALSLTGSQEEEAQMALLARLRKVRQYAKQRLTRRVNLATERLETIKSGPNLTVAMLEELGDFRATILEQYDKLEAAHEALTMEIPEEELATGDDYLEEEYRKAQKTVADLKEVLSSALARKIMKQHGPSETDLTTPRHHLDEGDNDMPDDEEDEEIAGIMQNPSRQSREQSPQRAVIQADVHQPRTDPATADLLRRLAQLEDQTRALQQPTAAPTTTGPSINAPAAATGLTMQQLGGILATNYDVTKHVNKFGGKDLLQYADWRSQWLTAAETMRQMGWKNGRLLREMKNCLEGRALDVVRGYLMSDVNYALAFQDLDDEFLDPTRHVKSLTEAVMNVENMKSDPASMLKVTTAVHVMVQQFQGLKLSGENQALVMLLALAEPKLNFNTRKAWLKLVKQKASTTSAIGTTATMQDFLDVMRRETKMAEQLSSQKQKIEKESKAKQNLPGTFNTQAQQKQKCELCGDAHNLKNCTRMERFRPKVIKDAAEKQDLCLLCFEPKHPNKTCKTTCKVCSSNAHHTNLHYYYVRPKYQGKKGAGQDKKQKEKKQDQAKPPVTAVTASPSDSDEDEDRNLRGLLRTCRAYLVGPDGSKLLVRVALDCLSQEQLIRRDIAAELGLYGPPCALRMTVAGGKTTEATTESKVNFHIEALDGTYKTEPIRATTIKTIATPFDSIEFNPQDYEHMKDISFTETYPLKHVKVDVLLGEPFYSHLECGETRRKDIQDPSAVKTKLGWVLAGNNPSQQQHEQRIYSTLMTRLEEEIGLIDFWKQEHNGIANTESDWSVDEFAAWDMMNTVTNYDSVKRRFQTGLLWKEDPSAYLDDNYRKAFQVMKSVKRNISSPHEMKLLDQAYRDYVHYEHAEVLSDPKAGSGFKYYLETHPVFKPGSTTKCRVVMNAASKNKATKKSLNDMLYKGPDLLPNLAQVQMRFRTNKVAILLDISKMFLQIGLDPTSSDALRFLWQFQDELTPTLMRMLVVTFGLISSPFQAIWVVHEIAKMHMKQYPEAARKILQDCYMDDLPTGAKTVELAKRLLQQVIEIFDAAHMQAHKFASNDPAALADLPEEDCTSTEVVSALGAKWRPKDDTLIYDFLKNVDDETILKDPTKRVILSTVSKIFDACGLISPFTLQAKILMQKIWQAGLGWDEVIEDSDILSRWTHWKSQLADMRELEIPRYVGECDDSMFLAVFADASLDAYGACGYLVSNQGSNLLFAKTRVAPKDLAPTKGHKDEDITALTIARLELLAALCGSKIGKFLAKGFDVSTEKIVYFTDSTITLARIKKGTANWKLWVGTRVGAILKTSTPDQWFHCPGVLNPADLASRGADMAALEKSAVWWHGPEFLTKPRDTWPQTPGYHAEDHKVDQFERKPNLQFAIKTAEDPLQELINRQSNLSKLLRIVAYAKRYVRKLRAKVTGTPMEAPKHLTVPELDDAMDACILSAQRASFSTEWEALRTGQPLPKSSPILSFDPYFDDKGIMRANSRLALADQLPTGQRFPILLPKNDRLSILVALHIHEINLHAGTETVLTLSRAKYRILGGRREIEKILKLCKKQLCRQPKPNLQQMAPVPKERTLIGRPFTNVALDYFGPMLVPKEDGDKKVWCCIFTCFSTRAVHLELVEDMTSSEFLNALKRLTARHGQPNTLYSDNAKQFKAAEKELGRLVRKLDNAELKTNLTAKGITWSYAIAEAPHTNALTERMIRCVKKALRIMLFKKRLTFRQLETLIIEVEGIVNKRPLCTVKMKEDELPITPAELVLGRTLDLLPDPVKLSDVDLKEVWAHRKHLLNSFWHRFRNDYLLELQPRKIWQRQPEKMPKEGDVVLLRDDHLSRNDWRMATVEELHPGKDGLPRLVRLRKPNGQMIHRHISRLAVLEAQ